MLHAEKLPDPESGPGERATRGIYNFAQGKLGMGLETKPHIYIPSSHSEYVDPGLYV